MLRLFLTKLFGYTSIALADDNKLIEYYIELPDEDIFLGAVFKGQVSNSITNMGATYVDIGQERRAFMETRGGRKKAPVNQSTIMCQLKVISEGEKPFRVSRDIDIAGAYLIISPLNKAVHVSTKLRNNGALDTLMTSIERINTYGYGVTIRTAARLATEETLQKEYEELHKRWLDIQSRYEKAPLGTCIWRGYNLLERAYCNFADSPCDEIVVNDISIVDELRTAFGSYNNRFFDLIKWIANRDLYELFGFAEQIFHINDRRVDMAFGGYLIIDTTEAMTVIDVNSGKYFGESGYSSSMFTVNMMSVPYIAEEIRKRAIAGIIVVDFIDMDTEEQKDALLEAMRTAVGEDRTRTRVEGISRLGLVEITRKRNNPSVRAKTTAICANCGGKGFTSSIEREAMHGYFDMYRTYLEVKKPFVMYVGRTMYEYLMADDIQRDEVNKWIAKVGITIRLDSSMPDCGKKIAL